MTKSEIRDLKEGDVIIDKMFDRFYVIDFIVNDSFRCYEIMQDENGKDYLDDHLLVFTKHELMTQMRRGI